MDWIQPAGRMEPMLFFSSAINPCTTTSASTMSAPQAWFADSVPQLLPGYGAPLMLLFRQMKFV